MEKAIKQVSVVGLSENDLRLSRYIELSEQAKKIGKELDQLKEEIKHAGSHTTKHFICVVKDQNRSISPTLEVLEEKYGPEVRKLCRTIVAKIISVSKK